MTPAEFLGAGAAICTGLCGSAFLARGIRAMIGAWRERREARRFRMRAGLRNALTAFLDRLEPETRQRVVGSVIGAIVGIAVGAFAALVSLR